MSLRRRAYFSSSGFFFERTLSSVQNYNVRSEALAAGWDGVLPLIARIIIPAGITISSSSTTMPALSFGGAYPAGSSASLIVAATAMICGAGGYGGDGGQPYSAGGPGSNGGTAVLTSVQLTIDNLGTIAGGGGGGGGGAGAFTPGTGGNPDALAGGGGGGGGAGIDSGPAGGAGSPYGFPVATAGTATTGGTGGARYTSTPVGGAVAISGNGGDGGALGQPGGPGGISANSSGGNGGSAGAYISGAAFTSWLNTGTRLGLSV